MIHVFRTYDIGAVHYVAECCVRNIYFRFCILLQLAVVWCMVLYYYRNRIDKPLYQGPIVVKMKCCRC